MGARDRLGDIGIVRRGGTGRSGCRDLDHRLADPARALCGAGNAPRATAARPVVEARIGAEP